jgi:transcriptional antiterminator RfaH
LATDTETHGVTGPVPGALAARQADPVGAAAAVQRWYLVHAKPAAEREAQLQLQRQGYHTYLPFALRRLRRRGRAIMQTVALFPRYLFVRLEEGRQSLTPVRSTFGVSNLVRFGNRCATVPEEIIRALQERADPHTGLHRLGVPALTRGTPVRIDGGAFAGLDGVFEREDGESRVVVLLRLLGEERQVQFPAEQVSVAC